jgi:hypothetical protein
MKSFILGTLAALALSGAASAAIVTVDVSHAFDLSGGQPFIDLTTNFFLPSDATNVQLNVVKARVDDAAVVQLNDTTLFGFGIFGPGEGNFYFTADGTSTPFTFAYGGRAGDTVFADGTTVNSGFSLGTTNTLHVLVNDNSHGINSGNGPLQSSNTSLNFDANVTYVTGDAAPGAVPEPASWALMISGFGLAGAALRRRRSAAATA